MQFEVPAGNALVFTANDGSILSSPTTRPVVRLVTALVRSTSTVAPSS